MNKKSKFKTIDNNKQSKYGRIEQRTNLPKGNTRGARGFLKFNKSKYDLTKLQSKSVLKI